MTKIQGNNIGILIKIQGNDKFLRCIQLKIKSNYTLKLCVKIRTTHP